MPKSPSSSIMLRDSSAQAPTAKTIAAKALPSKSSAHAVKAPAPKHDPIKDALAEIKKKYGDGAILQMGDTSSMNIERFSCGSIGLDIALGGGMPKSRIVEIYGPESSGKTTLALHSVAQVQKNGGRAAFIDAEHALDPHYAKKIGVDIDALLVSQPDSGEQALEIVETLVRSGAVDIIVIDSVAALTPQAEIDGAMGDAHMGLQARLMSQALRKLTSIVGKSNCTVIFINQLRMKIGVMFGNPETTAGGNALKFYCSLRLDVRRIDKIVQKTGSTTLTTGGKDDGSVAAATDEVIGSRTRVKVVKNKVAPPFRQAEFDVIYATGISKEGEMIDLGVKYSVLEKSGNFFRFGDETIGQGREQARIFLLQNPKIAEKIEKAIRTAAGV